MLRMLDLGGQGSDLSLVGLDAITANKPLAWEDTGFDEYLLYGNQT